MEMRREEDVLKRRKGDEREGENGEVLER